MKIKRNDNVFIISGKDKGKTGKVEKVLISKNQIAVTGVNISKKHLKPSKKNPHGGILDIVKPINVSNAMVVCPHCGKATRVANKITNNKKERICKKCAGNLDAGAKNVKA